MHIWKMNEIMQRIEKDHYGIDFGLFLHYEMGLPLHKILRITLAGSHKYHKKRDMYERKAILCSGNGSTEDSASRCRALDPLATCLSPSCGNSRIRWAWKPRRTGSWPSWSSTRRSPTL